MIAIALLIVVSIAAALGSLVIVLSNVALITKPAEASEVPGSVAVPSIASADKRRPTSSGGRTPGCRMCVFMTGDTTTVSALLRAPCPAVTVAATATHAVVMNHIRSLDGVKETVYRVNSAPQ